MPTQKKIIYISSFIAVLLALYCYNPFVLYFQSDDFIHIPLSAQGKLLQQNTFRPVCDISVMLDYSLRGKTAWGYHLTNLVLHIISCVTFFFFIRLILKRYAGLRDSNFISWLSTVLFFIYAMHSEPVLWILGRSAILATIFSLLFLYCFIRRKDAVIFIAGFIFWWIICLLTYESTWILPCFALMISIVSGKQRKTILKNELAYLSILLCIFIIYLILRDNYIHQVAAGYESGFLLNGDYALLLKHYALLFLRCFVPAFINYKILICLFALVVLFILWLFTSQKKKQFTLLVFLCLLISLLPYISLGVDTNGTESERFLYFPVMLVTVFFATVIIKAKSKMTYWIYPALFLMHVTVLFIVKENYIIAGNVNRQVAEALKNTPDKKIVYAVDVPQAQNGAFILRQGLPQMMQWLSGKHFDTLITCSRRYELLPLQYPYKIIFNDSLTLQCGASNNIIHSGKDRMLLKFTDSALFISK